MSELSPKARALMHAGRGALRPSDADRDRISDALRSKLGAEVLPLAAATAVTVRPARFARSSVRWVSGVVAGAFVGGALFLSFHHGNHPLPPAPAAAVLSPPSEPSAIAEPPSAPPADPELEVVAPPSSALPNKPNAPAVRSAPESLAREVAMLSSATSALHAGQPAQALKLLNEHARKFPNGVLSEERRAARAQALCMLGRIAEGQAELERLAPQSPAAARAKQVCAAK